MSVLNKTPLYGIVGGMGTAAGLAFQNMFFEHCHRNGIVTDQEYPEWIYINASKTPDRTKAVKGEGVTPVEYLTEIVKRMEAAGSDAVVVTCNTVHAFYEEIYDNAPLPWIHLQKETARKLRADGVNQVGVLATEGTIWAGLFSKYINPLGISVIEPEPDSEVQSKVTDAIYNPVYGIKHTGNVIRDKVKFILSDVINELGVDTIIAGCTELSVALAEMDIPVKYYDPMKIAAETLFDVWQGKRFIDSL